jgi:hypothetical protein
MDYADLRPGHILHELQEAYHAPAAVDRLSRGPLHFAAIWKVAQRMTTNQASEVWDHQRGLPADDGVGRALPL